MDINFFNTHRVKERTNYRAGQGTHAAMHCTRRLINCHGSVIERLRRTLFPDHPISLRTQVYRTTEYINVNNLFDSRRLECVEPALMVDELKSCNHHALDRSAEGLRRESTRVSEGLPNGELANILESMSGKMRYRLLLSDEYQSFHKVEKTERTTDIIVRREHIIHRISPVVVTDTNGSVSVAVGGELAWPSVQDVRRSRSSSQMAVREF